MFGNGRGSIIPHGKRQKGERKKKEKKTSRLTLTELVSDLAFGKMSFLKQPRQDTLPPVPKSRVQDEKRGEEEAQELSEWFSREEPKSKTVRYEASSTTQQTQTGNDPSLSGVVHSRIHQPKGQRRHQLAARRLDTDNKSASENTRDGQMRPASSTSPLCSPSPRTPSASTRSTNSRGVGGTASQYSSTPETARHTLASTDVYRGLDDLVRPQSTGPR